MEEGQKNRRGEERPTGSGGGTLLERLIDSPLEWRQVICEANGGERALASLSQLQIKRQEVIHELVQTERHHCLTLALMRQVYLNGLRRLNEVRCEQASLLATGSKHQLASNLPSGELPPASDLIDLERLFPALEELIQAHELFFAHLRLRLVESCKSSSACLDNSNQRKSPPLLGLVGPLGELLYETFRVSPPIAPPEAAPSEQQAPGQRNAKGNGHKLLAAYAKFCGQHNDSSRYYKHLMQADKPFKQFIEQCNKLHPACRQRGIPECNLLVTQRLTKYPLLIDQLIKTSKEEPAEEQKLRLALAECKALLAELNNQLARKESFERLLGIYAQFCPKSYTIYNRHLKFTKHDLLQHKRLRRLLHSDGQLRVWSAHRRKLLQVLCLILNDIVVFLRVEAPSQQPAAPLPAQQEVESAGSVAQAALAESSSQESGESTASQQSASLINVVASALHQSGQQLDVAAAAAASTGSGGTFSVRYYFANIDQKSSVISLSKLLIREKAANDCDGPRIYLISSSPKQPEMYELAFVSKRHQTSFVEKLKACVEQHTRSLLQGDAEDAINEQDEDQLYPNGCCHFHEPAGRRRPSNSSEEEEEEEEDEDEEEEDEEELRFSGKLDAGSVGSLEPKVSGGAGGRELDFELDIEQDVIIPSREQEEDASNAQPPEAEAETQDAGEQTDSNELASNESGLSERARDSLDESSSLARKVRVNQRRRRAHRPRNVSNQSSSSSEAAHRQAIQMIQSVGGSAPGCPEAKASSGGGYLEEDFDSGRGHDDSSSSSAASISSSSLEPEKDPEKRKQSASSETAPTEENQKPAAEPNCPSSLPKSINALKSATSSASSTTSSRSSTNLKEAASLESGNGTRTSNLVKCSSVLSKSACSIKQQRKLSTVSTMSSQLKLLSKFKSSGSSSQVQQGVNGASHCSSTLSHPLHQLASSCAQCDTARAGSGGLFSKQARQNMRRSTFIPEQKLEELRDLRIQLDKDKQEWQAKFDRMQEQLLNERRELDLAREKLKQDKQQIANEREQLYRKLDLLKEKGILLSPSHKVIITSPDAAAMMYQQQQQQQHYIPNECIPAPNSQQIQLINVSNNQRHQPLGYNLTSSIRINQPIDNRQATNLFIQNQPPAGQPGKVPLHLSEHQTGSGSGAPTISTAQRVTSSFGLNKFPPLMQVFGGSIGLISSATDSTKQSNHQHLESHLI